MSASWHHATPQKFADLDAKTGKQSILVFVLFLYFCIYFLVSLQESQHLDSHLVGYVAFIHKTIDILIFLFIVSL